MKKCSSCRHSAGVDRSGKVCGVCFGFGTVPGTEERGFRNPRNRGEFTPIPELGEYQLAAGVIHKAGQYIDRED